MHQFEKINALRAIAQKCNAELQPVDRNDLSSMARIMNKWAGQALALGFSKTEMMVQIGYLNKTLTNHRED